MGLFMKIKTENLIPILNMNRHGKVPQLERHMDLLKSKQGQV